ncbi:MAG: DUF159 family protein [Betaproteobacteria bacterium HGW-Betaproteobacteria-12]|nr:MAG: DUF159 family protein [Betaproteobacteria bacterium HGW-Betaproteobacteria-12]
MCVNYAPIISSSTLHEFFDVTADGGLLPEFKASVWPGYAGPFIRQSEVAGVGDEAVPVRELLTGAFGLVPQWAKDETFGRRTYNARAETAHEKPSFRESWRLARHCIIPAEAFYEPDWRTGKAIATRISRADGKPMGLAGLWAPRRLPGGALTHSFTMLTINADQHPFMNQFHRPDDEKRMVVILPERDYDDWLQAPASATGDFLLPFPAEKLQSTVPQQRLL